MSIQNYVILESSHGDHCTYPATVAIAKKIFDNHLDAIPPKVIEFGSIDITQRPIILTKNDILDILTIALNDEPGSLLLDTDSHIDSKLLTKQMTQELVMFCFNNKVKIENGRIDEYAFFKVFKLDSIPWLYNLLEAHFKEKIPNKDLSQALIWDDYTKDQLKRYRVIKSDNWAKTATDIRKINYILEFANELTHRDVKYSLIPMRNNC